MRIENLGCVDGVNENVPPDDRRDSNINCYCQLVGMCVGFCENNGRYYK